MQKRRNRNGNPAYERKMVKSISFSNYGIEDKFGYFPERVCIFLDGMWLDKPEFQLAQKRILFIGGEPPEIYKQHININDVILHHSLFDLILTTNEEILQHCPNSILFPFGSSHVSPCYDYIEKEKKIVFLCGVKAMLPGHLLRHEILKTNLVSILPLEKYYTWPKHIESLLKPAMYAIVVENTQHPFYFTEKIINCLVLKTIPIYWGCLNIEDFFDTKTILQFNNIEELQNQLKIATPSYYYSNFDYVQKNFEKALPFVDFFERINKIINKTFYE